MPNDLVFSRSGKWFAYCDERLRLWRWPERRLVENLDLRSSPVQFSLDEKRLLCRTPQGFEVFSMETNQVISSVTTTPEFLAWHPSGNWLITRPRQDQIGIVDLVSGQTLKTLYSGIVTDASHLAAVFSNTLNSAGLGEEQLRAMKEQFVRGSAEPFKMAFSPSAKLLFCATTRGLRVLEWEKVLTAEKATPKPMLVVLPKPQPDAPDPFAPPDYTNYVYDFALDEQEKRVLFCGIEGTVRYFNLNNGTTGVLLNPPRKGSIWRIQLSTDREYLYCYCTPTLEERNRKPNRIEIWNYRLLRAGVGLD